jgi:capsule biosynthesis phosphatase
MHVFVLCGGSGSRMNDYSFPKPLNMIWGKPAIYYTLMNLPDFVDTIHFIVAPHLEKYNFEQIVINLFKTKHCIFHKLPYFTRGAAESAWLGTSQLELTEEPLIFLDNDVIYDFPKDFFSTKFSTAFLGFADDLTGSESFSFLKVDNENNVIDYKEKVRISNLYCCGLYGFASLSSFRSCVLECLFDISSSEIYMSSLYKLMLSKSIQIKGVHFELSRHIGTLVELKRDLDKLPMRSMRICFDLDNTLVTYPTTPGDYSTVKPIANMIELAQRLKKSGHTIIIHTARRMATHGGNVGAVIKDIGYQTFQTLADFNIPCDELLFGKPIADMYIDDRAINPYRNDISCMGLVDFEYKEKPINMLENNKHNTIIINGDIVEKTGPSIFIDGELYYYKNIPTEKKIAQYFPAFSGWKNQGESSKTIFIEQIKGIPFYTLYLHKLLSEKHISDLFEFLDCLHNQINSGVLPSQTNIYNNYVKKLENRFKIAEDYPFADARKLQDECLSNLTILKDFDIRNMIHGDLWFSNIILDFRNNLKVFDMKGKVDEILTLGGDSYYDYGKLYQSFLGYDAALYGHSIDEVYKEKMLTYFLNKIMTRGIDYKRLKEITFSLVMGVFHSLKNYETKQRIWEWIHICRSKNEL